MPDELRRELAQAWERLQAGDPAAARSLCQSALRRDPRNPDALFILGVTHLMSGQPRDAVPVLRQLIAAQAQHGPALENLGLAHLMLGESADAERALRAAAALPGAPASVLMRLGVAILQQGRHADAVAVLNSALEADPCNADIHLNLGQALTAGGDRAAARKQFERALELAPEHADAMYNLGVICLQEDDLSGARGWFERAIARAPQHVEALVNLGVVHEREQHLDAAYACFKRALEIDPASAQARNNLANALARQGNLEAAREQYHAALRISPDYAEAREGLASTCLALAALPGRGALLAEAEAEAQRANALDPAAAGPYGILADINSLRGTREVAVELLETGYQRSTAPSLLGELAFQLRYLCEWDKWRGAWEKVASLLDAGAQLGTPFSLLAQPVTAAQQLGYARRWSQAQFGNIAPLPAVPAQPARAGRRHRVGYISSDLRQHAIGDLIVEVLELHDRSRFEIFAYSHGADDGSPLRARLKQACEHFVDIANLADEPAARRIRDDELDLLIDLNGHTRGARTAILARRPCRRQACWLGYPGTTGAPFIDYLLADPFIIPAGRESAYSERILRLPHCYQPNDRRRGILPALSRAEYGLPDTAFVFCCFQQAYKITPEIYGAWMRLMRDTANSVLWLLEDNARATKNLKAAAQARGVAPTRLVFAPKVPLAQHLARHGAADLALDTYPCNSHTTASDALWGNCLLVGLAGETFAARVSGSILTACNLPELVTYSLAEYEQLALRLATDEAFRKELRTRLADARMNSPLFDSAAFTRDLESLYTDLVARS